MIIVVTADSNLFLRQLSVPISYENGRTEEFFQQQRPIKTKKDATHNIQNTITPKGDFVAIICCMQAASDKDRECF